MVRGASTFDHLFTPLPPFAKKKKKNEQNKKQKQKQNKNKKQNKQEKKNSSLAPFHFDVPCPPPQIECPRFMVLSQIFSVVITQRCQTRYLVAQLGDLQHPFRNIDTKFGLLYSNAREIIFYIWAICKIKGSKEFSLQLLEYKAIRIAYSIISEIRGSVQYSSSRGFSPSRVVLKC